MDDGYYVNNDSAYTNIGTCDYYSIAYISIRGEMKYRLNQKIDIYDGKFITVEFLDNKGAIIHSVPVESGKEIKWVPGTKARVKWKFYSVEWRKYKKAYIEKLRVTAVTF
ncbi:MAG: hypothetical protein IPI23_01020 [Bacteroidetes bacterium]|nr:hypothetical protein [Bacteroidota bacterium]